MPTDVRDRDALRLARSRSFHDCALVSLELDMETRRLTMCVYGALRPSDEGTQLATLKFFGVSNFTIGGVTDAFPSSARIAGLDVAYADEDESGSVAMRGRAGWTLRLSFEGIAYREYPAVLASLVDDDA